MGLSVLTLVKNRSGHLAELIEGLRRSTIKPDQLVIVDMNDNPISHPPASLPTDIVRLGPCALPLARARNAAADRATHAHLLFLDVDCIPSRGLIGAIDAALAATDSLICAEIGYLAAGQSHAGWDEATLKTQAMVHPVRSFPASGMQRLTNPGLFWSLAFGVRRERFADLAGFDEAFQGYGGEDTDFAFRADAAGVPIILAAGPGAFHQHHDVFDPPLHHFEDIVRNAAIFHAKWGVWPMEGWLHAFADLGLIGFDRYRLHVLRAPTAREIMAAKRGPESRF